MGSSQANNDNLVEQLKNLAQESARRKQAKADQQSSGQQAKAFIRDHAREEKDNLMRLLGERIQEVNASAGNSPQFVILGSSVQLGDAILSLKFDQQFTNPDDYILVLEVRLAPLRGPLFGTEPTPKSHILRATASDDLSSILWGWEGHQGRSTSDQLVEVALELLISYVSKHRLI